MRVFFKVYDSKMASREKLFKAAVEYATQIGPEQLITITHSEDRDNIVISIWYWAEEEIKPVVKPAEIKAKGSVRPGQPPSVEETQRPDPKDLPAAKPDQADDPEDMEATRVVEPKQMQPEPPKKKVPLPPIDLTNMGLQD